MSNRFKTWELALLLALAVTLLWGARSAERQERLSSRLIRLHVVADSDDPADQERKLLVRDRVAELTAELLEGAADAADALARLERSLPALEAAAGAELSRLGCGDGVTVSLERAVFPRRSYEGFTLPAGEYTALRVVIGEGRGRNWWCVVFPPLCGASAADLAETAEEDGLDGEDVSLITGAEPVYVLKFRSVELWERLRQWLGK
jgi:stage II sporulation protein R